MYIIVIGWIYVVFMMAITETSVVAGVLTFLLYGALPVSLIVYIGNTGKRRARKERKARNAISPDHPNETNTATKEKESEKRE